MIDAVGFIVEVIIAVIAAGVLFVYETTTNFAPHKNLKRAMHRVKKDVIHHQLN